MRYHAARRAEEHRLLDEIVAVARIHRKAASGWYDVGPGSPISRSRATRPLAYGPEVARAAEVLWQAAGRIGAHGLHPFVPELLARLTQCGELTSAPTVEKLVGQANRPTLARLLAPARAQYPPRGATITRPGTWLEHEIPPRISAKWDDARPGALEVGLMAHCGRHRRRWPR